VSGFLFSLLAALVASLGARDQLLVARLTAANGARPFLLVTAVLTAALTCALAAWAGARLLGEIAPALRGTVAALGLIAAGGEMLLLGPGRPPAEPTRSLAAAAIVLLAHQVTDAARLLVFGLAVALAAPVPAGIGGAVGSAAALALGWLAPRWPARLGRARRLVGGTMAVGGGIALLA